MSTTPHRRNLAPLLPLVLVLGGWETICALGWVDAFLLPAPSAIARTLWADRAELARASGVTGLGALYGFAASACFGVGTAVALSTSRWLLAAFAPYAVIFQTVPIIAVAPLLVIWFGYGLPTVVSSTFLASVFPVLSATLAGLAATDRALLDLFRLYGAKRRATLFKLVLPHALPEILIGLRIAAGLAVIGAIVGEFVGGGGLGNIVDIARTQQRVDKVFAAVLVASVLGALAVGAVNGASRRLLARWRPALVA